MSTWSGIRHKLEKVYLAESLRGHIQYYATTYRQSHDREGKAVIRLDGNPVLSGCYWNFSHLDFLNYTSANADRLERGAFDQHNFYAAFAEFDNQSIVQSLSSENLLVRIFAVLDKRVGKRRLTAMQEQISQESTILQRFYRIRMNAEGLSIDSV